MNVYLLSGKDSYRLQKRLETLMDEFNIGKDNRIFFDGSDKKSFLLESALMECGMQSLFAEDAAKAVIIKNPYFLNPNVTETKTQKNGEVKEKRIEMLNQYFSDASSDTLLIFYCDQFECDKRKAEYKTMQKNAVKCLFFEEMKYWEFESYVNTELKKEQIHLTPDALNELIKRINNNNLIFHQTIDKIHLYGKDKLDLQDIKKIVSINPEVNAFDMSNAFIKGNLAACLRSLEDMLQANYDYMRIMNLLVGKIRTTFYMKRLQEKGLTQNEIATRLHANPKAVKMTLDNCIGVNSNKLLLYINELADLDQNIKLGKVNPKDGFEQFIIQNGDANGRH